MTYSLYTLDRATTITKDTGIAATLRTLADNLNSDCATDDTDPSSLDYLIVSAEGDEYRAHIDSHGILHVQGGAGSEQVCNVIHGWIMAIL